MNRRKKHKKTKGKTKKSQSTWDGGYNYRIGANQAGGRHKKRKGNQKGGWAGGLAAGLLLSTLLTGGLSMGKSAVDNATKK